MDKFVFLIWFCAIFPCFVSTNKPSENKLSEEVRRRSHQRIASRTMRDYIKCLNKKERNKSSEDEAILVVQGMKINMPCGYCAKPEESVEGIWRLSIPKIATVGVVKLDGSRIRILSDLSLSIVRPKNTDSGEYFCIVKNTIYAHYNLDVVEEEPHHIIRQIGKNPFKLKNVTLLDKNLIILSKWSSWSKCDRCGKVGRRRRIGICTVQKIESTKPSLPAEVKLLNVFRTGLPCRSLRLPKSIKTMKEVKERKTEFLIGFCKIKCPTPPPIQLVTNKNGELIDVIDHSKGEFSINGRFPSIPPIVARQTIYKTEGSYLKLVCPGSEGNYLIWRNRSWVINPAYVHVKTKGRVMIDLANILHIRQLRFSDSVVYSCWEDARLVGTIRLYVTPTIPYKETKVMALNVCLLITVLVVFYITIKALKNKKLSDET